MLASDIVRRARSLADIPRSSFISHDDETQSLWESYKDIYSRITDSSDDYYITKVEIDTSTATKLGDNEWELTLPAGIYKLRFVDYKNNGQWASMSKFATANRNRLASAPQYRWRGDKLWIIGSGWSGLPPYIRIDYYPSPVEPTTPEATKEYGTAYAAYNKQLIGSPQYFTMPNANGSPTDYMLYIYNGAAIIVQSLTLATSTTLYTSTGLTNCMYHRGYIYYLKSGNIYRATTDLAATITPAAILTVGTITSFVVYGSKVYYSDGTNTKSANLDGSSPAVLYAYTSTGVAVVGADLYYIKIADGLIYKTGVSTGIAALTLAGDGTYVYYTDSAGMLHKYTDTTDEIIAQDIVLNGSPADGFVSAMDTSSNVYAVSTVSDTDFDYPLNEAWEIMAYQSAIDYKRKQNGDPTLLMARLAEINDRFADVLKRDEYQPERRAPESPYWNY